MQVISIMLSNWKNIIKQNNDSHMFLTTQHHFIPNSGVVMIQKVTLKGAALDSYNSN